MLTSRWRKLIGDLCLNKMRTLSVVLAMSIGVFGLSVVANSYSILMREMNINYMKTTPASATLLTDSLSDSYIQEIRNLPYIKDAEKREKVVGRVEVGDKKWKYIELFVINDFSDARLDTFTSEKGKAVPATGEILFERKALSIANAEIGQSINIKIPNGGKTTLKLSGTVHAPGLAPAWMEGFAYGFITPETLKLLGGSSQNTQLKILVAGDELNKNHIKDNAYLLKDHLEKDGFKVIHIEIPEPGKHPHNNQIAMLLFLMEMFGVIALILSAVLISSMIISMIKQQTRQIGIMKAIGASSLQISGLYQGMVLILSIVAVLISIPTGIFVGQKYAWIAAQILNFKIFSYSIPLYIIVLEIAAGLLIPLLTALHPIYKGSKITVREAINDFGISQEKYGIKSSEPKLRILMSLPRPLILSIRNTFRRKGRLLFTMLIVAVGGIGFLVAMNLYASMNNSIEEKIESISYDIQVNFNSPQASKSIVNIINEIPGVLKVEAWSSAIASLVYNDGTAGNNFDIIAPPSSTSLMSEPPLCAGRWLNSNDTNSLVINQKLLANEPDIKLGDEITLRIGHSDTRWKIIGISVEMIGGSSAYANLEYLSEITSNKGFATTAVVRTNNRSLDSQASVAKLLEQKMIDKGTDVRSLFNISDYRAAIEAHNLLIATFLIFFSLLVVLVGGLGLATTISINVMERTREIGIMRAIGASTTSLTGTIVIEGMVIGVLSWLVSILLSWPISKIVCTNFGEIFFELPLKLVLSSSGYIIWFAVIVIFAALASLYPSRKASKLSVLNALSYE